MPYQAAVQSVWRNTCAAQGCLAHVPPVVEVAAEAGAAGGADGAGNILTQAAERRAGSVAEQMPAAEGTSLAHRSTRMC